jgi:hypothetical protein
MSIPSVPNPACDGSAYGPPGYSVPPVFAPGRGLPAYYPAQDGLISVATPRPGGVSPYRGSNNAVAITGFLIAVLAFIPACLPIVTYFGWPCELAALIVSIVGACRPHQKSLAVAGICVSAVALPISSIVAIFLL